MFYQFKRTPQVLAACAVFCGAAVWCLPATAAISIDNSVTTTTDPKTVYDASFQYWNNVGNQTDNTPNGGGVYLKNGWVIAPAHISSNPPGFRFNGTLYPRAVQADGVTFKSPVVIYNDPGTNSSPTDLVLYQVKTQGLPPLAELAVNPATPLIGTTVLLTGFGYGRQSPLTYWDAAGNPSSTPPSGNYHTGYLWDSSTDIKRWGTNKVSVTGHTVDDGSGIFQSIWTTFTDPNTTVSLANDPGGSSTQYEASAAPGDSGGGVFIKNGATWVLAGLLHATDPFPTVANDNASGFYNPVLDGIVADDNSTFAARTYSSDLSAYASQINAVIPEPGTVWSISMLLGAGLLRRRARR